MIIQRETTDTANGSAGCGGGQRVRESESQSVNTTNASKQLELEPTHSERAVVWWWCGYTETRSDAFLGFLPLTEIQSVS